MQLNNIHGKLIKSKKDNTLSCLSDPFEADEFFISELPALNLTGNIVRIISFANSLRLPPDINNVVVAQAAMRDLGMLVSSLSKFEVSPSKWAGIKSKLIYLSKILNEVPRDTLYSYISRNPKDKRIRTFTGLSEEKFFINNVNDWLEKQEICLVFLLELKFSEMTREKSLDNSKNILNLIQ